QFDPRPLLLDDGQHPLDQARALIVVRQALHGTVELVELRVAEVRLIRPLALRLRVCAFQKEEEVLRVRIVGAPSREETLIGPRAELLLKLVEGSGIDLDVEAELAPAGDEELVLQLRLRAGLAGVEGDLQRLARCRIDAALVASLRE